MREDNGKIFGGTDVLTTYKTYQEVYDNLPDVELLMEK